MTMEAIPRDLQSNVLMDITAMSDRHGGHCHSCAGSTGGCSICDRIKSAKYDPHARALAVELGDFPNPESFRLTVLVDAAAGDRTYAPQLGALWALLHARSATWELPADAPIPQVMHLQLEYVESGEQVIGKVNVALS